MTRFLHWHVLAGSPTFALVDSATVTITANASIRADWVQQFTCSTSATTGTITPADTTVDSASVITNLAHTPATGYGWNGLFVITGGTPNADTSEITIDTTTTIAAVDTVIPTLIAYTTPQTYTRGTPITVNPTTWTNVTSSTITGQPAGTAITSASGQITETPTTAGTGTATIIATGPVILDTATIAWTVNPALPVISYAADLSKCSTAVIITPAVMTNTGDAGTVRVEPVLPVGLSLGAGGTISGTPTTITGSAAYSVIDSNITGKDTADVTIEVFLGLPVISRTHHAWNLTKGAITGRDSLISSKGAIDTVDVDTLAPGMLLDSTTWAFYVDSLTDAGTWICVSRAANASGFSNYDTVTITITVASSRNRIFQWIKRRLGYGFGF